MPVFPPPMGGAPPPPGGQAGAGPASNPGPMAGNAAHGMEKLKLGLKALQDSLSALPMGSPVHTAVLKALTDVGKEIEKHSGGTQGDPSAQIQQLIEMARAAKQGGGAPPMPGGGAPPPMPGGGPPAPPMGA